MDQSRSPILDAIEEYHRLDRYGYSPPGHRLERGIELPDPGDPALKTIGVVRDVSGWA